MGRANGLEWGGGSLLDATQRLDSVSLQECDDAAGEIGSEVQIVSRPPAQNPSSNNGDHRLFRWQPLVIRGLS